MIRKYLTLLGYAGRQRRRFATIVALTLTASVVAVGQPWPMKLVVDHVLQGQPLPSVFDSALQGVGLAGTPLTLLTIGAVGGLLLFALTSALEVALTAAWTVAGRRLVYDVAERLFARLQRRSLLFHSRHPVGDVMSRITGDSWCGYQLLDKLVFGPGHALVMIALMVCLMVPLNWKLTLLAVGLAPLMVGASLLVGRPLQLAAKLKREVESKIQAQIQQTLTGIPVVQAFVQEEREHERFGQFAEQAIRAQQRTTLLGSVNSLSSGLVTSLGTGAVLWLGAMQVLAGTLTLGSLLVFIVYLTSLQAQIKILADVYTGLRGVNASVDRVDEMLQADPEIKEKSDAIALPPVRGHVVLEEVAYGYEPDCAVLRDVSLEARPGRTLAIVGPTGAGKSTLVNLLPRFFDPWSGRVLVDGTDIRHVRLDSLRAQIAIVLQEPFLFPLSIAENIAFSRPDSSREEIEAAARAANAHAFIERLSDGYDTVIGERGATLSGGERQRLAIARALLKNAPILILDEPTSALDAETEQLLLSALERLMLDRTTFIIAHRLSTVRRADLILVLDQGRIVEQGRHEDLLDRGGHYARLHKAQFGGGDERPPGVAS